MSRYAPCALLTMAVAGVLGAATALRVVTPSEGLTVVAERTYTVEWTGTGDSDRFEIDLYHCGSFCTEDDCGEWVTALCPYGATGCPDSDGDYNVVMPEPTTGSEGGTYKVRVMDVDDESNVDCSGGFRILPSSEMPQVGDHDGPYLTVISPTNGDFAHAGEEYTVEFDYDNGVGSSVDRFAIDLYKATGSGDCGEWVTSICDKPGIGCKDSMGDYNVVIPAGTEAGDYSIRVGRFENDALYGCSGVFEVSAQWDRDDFSMSMSF